MADAGRCIHAYVRGRWLVSVITPSVRPRELNEQGIFSHASLQPPHQMFVNSLYLPIILIFVNYIHRLDGIPMSLMLKLYLVLALTAVGLSQPGIPRYMLMSFLGDTRDIF